MKRFLGVGITGLVVVAAACVGIDSLTGPKTESQGGAASPTGVTAQSACPSPSPLPLAIFSANRPITVTSCASPSTLSAVFKVHPQSGPAPLDVAFNMCLSSDSDPTVNLHFHVDFGDGSSTGGSQCNYHNTYTIPGTYSATACVWDGNPVTNPGTCQPFTIAVAQSCAVTFSNPRPDPTGNCFAPGCSCEVFVDALTAGNGTCGNPLVVDLNGLQFFSGPSFDSGSQGFCPPGKTCTLSFIVPNGSTDQTFTGVNAVGSLTWGFNASCG
jgi:hypothetical protein